MSFPQPQPAVPHAKAAVRELLALLELAHEGIFVRDMDDAVTYWNRGAEALYGWMAAEALGRVTHSLLQTAFPAPIEEINEALLCTGRWEGELQHTCKDGARVVVASRWALQRDERGAPVAVLETNDDITARKRAEQAGLLASEALRDAEAALARVNRVTTLGVLAASIAHEVNQPLGAMTTSAAACARWLAAQPPEMEKARAALQRIATDGKRAAQVVDRIRALVNRQAPRRNCVDVNEAIIEVIALTRHEVRRKAITLEMSLAPDVPLVEGDRVQLQQVVLNLLVNAIEAMSAGGGAGSRELGIGSAKDGADAVTVEVRDSGPGVDAGHVDRLFEAFYTTKHDGIGLGLSISRSIIEAHGGRLWVAPNAPHGAAFRFSLPVPHPVS
jgi:PAS domain S-box-containing protein